MNAVVELTEVSKRYTGADRPALSGVDLSIGDGEFTAIMGPSGSGKSTLLNLIAGLDKPDSGSIVVAGAAVGAMSESEAARFRRDRLGVIFQFFHLLPTLSVSDNILVPAQLAGMKSATAERRCRDLLDRLGLSDKAQAYPAKLSGGQQQRVAIARALINEPRLVLADEPTGALDSASGEQVMELIDQLHDGGQTIILVTHDARLAARYAGRVVSLVDGRIADDATLSASASGGIGELVQVRSQVSPT